jgi:tetrapyrrole methylase family protein/MazG family protein
MLDALLGEVRRRWAVDLTAGLAVVAAERLVATPIEPSLPLLVVPAASLGGPLAAGRGSAVPQPQPLPGRHGPSGRDPLAVLRRLYPTGHRVGRLGRPDDTVVEALEPADLAGALFLAPVTPEQAVAGPWAMPYVSDRLRRPDGCPWDREQTHASLRKHLLEEAYEVYDALAAGATPDLAEELGDLLLQVVLHAQLAAEAGVFDLSDVWQVLTRKVVRRHPHVFGQASASTAADVTRLWEQVKADERAAAEAAAEAADEAPTEAAAEAMPARGALDGLSRSMPALAASQEMAERAAALGYDWPDVADILDKVAEELAELAAAADPAQRAEEFGDLLLVLVNVGRRLGIEAEAALRAANDKFRVRFGRVERLAAERGVALRELDFATLDALWDAAKAEERST